MNPKKKVFGKKTEHRVVLYVTKECDDRTMSEKQVAEWVADQFKGCDYGSVRVADVITQET